MSDPLASLVELLHPQSLVWKYAAGQEAWSWRMPADDGVVFGRVLEGSCRYDVPGIGSGTLADHDTFLLVAPPLWSLTSLDGTGESIDFDALPSDVLGIGTDDELANGGVRVVGGHFTFDAVNSQLLLPYLARMTHIRSGTGRLDNQLDALLNLFDAETSGSRPGREIVLSRLLEILLVELIRAPRARDSHQLGMMSGLADVQIGPALRAFHADIGHKWSVTSLADVAMMSRSAFADRFASRVGTAPMQYVTQWRMATARDSLREGSRSIGEISIATGYGSRSAFSTAFSRAVGESPAQFAGTGPQAALRKPSSSADTPEVKQLT